MSDQSPARILHVDDEEGPRRDLQEFLKEEDLAGWGPPVVHGIASFDDALDELERSRYDLVVLDVRDEGHGDRDLHAVDEDDAGARLLSEIQKRRYVPVVFFTGVAAQVSTLASPSIRVVEKRDGADVAVAAIRDLFDARLPIVNRALVSFVERQQREYMWDFVDEHWDDLAVEGDPAAVAYLLARRIGKSLTGPAVKQLSESLGASPMLASTGKVHPIELYVIPPLPDVGLALGSILRGTVGEDAGWWIILTPSCDLATGRVKADRVLLVACQPLAETAQFKTWQDPTAKPSQKLSDVLSNKTGGQHDRFLFLPSAVQLPDLVADFQRVLTVDHAVVAGLDHVASLESPFAEAMLNRSQRYFGRIGTPDLDADVALQRIRTSLP